MILLEELKQKIKQELILDQAAFSYPPSLELGDLSLACFELAKTRGQNQVNLALELATDLNNRAELKKYFSNIKAYGPYLNFFIASDYLAGRIIKEIKTAKDSYGSSKYGAGKKVMIEYSNGNTHKEYHVGHLRNISYGDAINKLLSANGFNSIPVSYINDFGIHVAKTIWNWQRDKSYQNSSEPRGYLLGKCYAAASQELEKRPEFKAEVTKIMKNIESRTGADYKLWAETRQWSIDYFDSIYKELDVKFDNIYYENEVVAEGLNLVEQFKKQGILKLSEGAIIADLEQYNLGVLPVIRTDGTALYPVADLALASEKFKKYNLDESIYVIDVRQSLYFKQLFKILELTGYRPAVFHLSYDFVTLPSGMMSSRTGNIITYQELKDKIFLKLKEETRKHHADWTEARVNKTALSLTISTIKFEMLKVGSDKVITFNIDEALKFDGYTACYLEYGYARLKSIIRKDKFHLFAGRADLSELTENKEKELLLKIAKYPDIISLARLKYKPSELTKYLFELVQSFNDYYQEVNILKSAKKKRLARLELIKAIAQVINNGFKILGMESLEEM
ncbi:MAG: arginine--tRNA ligase [Patescibacteria group bacterium]